ncbi:MAG: hypothetical protein ACYC56_13375 [Candidatus Aquicultor sp.]
MTWKPEVDELESRKRLAEQMGGPEGVARRRKQGILSIPEIPGLFCANLSRRRNR